MSENFVVDWRDVAGWNISFSDGWAKIVAKAINEGTIYRESRRCKGPRKSDLESIRQWFINRSDSFGGPFAWVSSGGVIIPVGFGSHDYVAEKLLGKTVSDVEKAYARITASDKNFHEPMNYVAPVHRTEAMQDSVVKFMSENRGGFWPEMQKLAEGLNS